MNKINNILLKALPYIVAIILFVICVRQCRTNSDIRQQMQHNIEALTDTVREYKTISGDIAAEKSILIGDINLLKHTNDSLYKRVKELGVKKPQQVVYIKNDIIHERHDTAWKVYSPNMTKDFDFSNKWRVLSGNVSLKDSVLGLSIEKDIVHLDYTMAIKDGRVYVSSTNPYVKFNDIQGIAIPKQKQKRLHIGPFVGAGIDINGKVRPNIGVGLTYSIISF